MTKNIFLFKKRHKIVLERKSLQIEFFTIHKTVRSDRSRSEFSHSGLVGVEHFIEEYPFLLRLLTLNNLHFYFGNDFVKILQFTSVTSHRVTELLIVK